VCVQILTSMHRLCVMGEGMDFYPTRGQLEGLWWGSCASDVSLGVPCRCKEVLQPFTKGVAVARHCEQGSAELASTDQQPRGRRGGG